MRSFLNYMGGKSRLAGVIAARLPAARCYVEVFGGAGWVLFARDPAPVEVWNDADGRLANLYRVVRDEPAALSRALTLLPRSRLTYSEFLRAAPDGDRVRAAAVYYFLIKNAFSGRVGYGFSVSRSCAPKYSMTNDFTAWAERLKKVTLEDLPFDDCLGRYDGRGSAFYLDPPYIGKEKYYGGSFAAADHERLAACLARAKGRWLLSYNDCAEVRRLYRGFKVTTVPAAYSAAKVRAGGRRAAPGRELLIANYEVAR